MTLYKVLILARRWTRKYPLHNRLWLRIEIEIPWFHFTSLHGYAAYLWFSWCLPLPLPSLFYIIQLLSVASARAGLSKQAVAQLVILLVGMELVVRHLCTVLQLQVMKLMLAVQQVSFKSKCWAQSWGAVRRTVLTYSKRFSMPWIYRRRSCMCWLQLVFVERIARKRLLLPGWPSWCL